MTTDDLTTTGAAATIEPVVEAVVVPVVETAEPAVETPAETKIPESVSERFLASFATSLASKVTATLVEQLATQLAETKATEAAAAAETAATEAAATEEAEAKEKAAADEETKEKEKKKTAPEDMKTTLHKLDSVYDSEGERTFVAWDPARARSSDDDSVPNSHSNWVLVLRRVFGHDNNLRRTKLDVKSPLIRAIIKDVVPVEKAAMESEKASVVWPNADLFRYREHIHAAAAKQGPLAVAHVAVLSELIRDEYADRIEDVNNMIPKGIASYEILREAYWPGDLIVNACSGSCAFRVTGVEYVTTWERKEYLDIDAEYVNSDGTKFGTQSTSFQIPKFKGIKYLKELPTFPIKCLENADELKASLLARGKKWAELSQGQHYMRHIGIGRIIEYPHGRVNLDSRCMIDTETYNRKNANYEIAVSSLEDELEDGKPTDEHYIIATDTIPIFSFNEKQFYNIKVANVTDIVFNDKVFDQLVLPASQKELVRVLVQNHSKTSGFDDFIEGKGKGLVSVLHGPPGVGKTMTAEAVAEFTRRPLYIVTSGELGSNPSSMETELERVLDLAKTFRAVLLLDEADVFLEQRTTSDLVRNALVSIFLRQLEYYQGILFLTTNRVAAFDAAFHSRIHISLHYASLAPAARERVWRSFGAAVRAALADADYARLAREPLNGRQIKNVVRTCEALAADKGERIAMRHIETVLSVVRGFDLAKMQEHAA